MIKFYIIFFILTSVFLSCSSEIYPSTLPQKIKPGDLIFQDLDCGDLCNAIEKVTAVKGYPSVSHVAIVEKISKDRIILVEAYKKVKTIEFSLFAQRSRTSRGKAKIIVARLKKQYKNHIPFVLSEIKLRIGKPYDEEFLPDNGKYYCSELISDSFATIGVDLFPRKPMFFGKEGSYSKKVWKKYFKRKGKLIPEGIPGTNPQNILSSKYLKIIYNYKH